VAPAYCRCAIKTSKETVSRRFTAATQVPSATATRHDISGPRARSIARNASICGWRVSNGSIATKIDRPGHFGSSLNSGSIVIDPKATRQSDRSFRPFARQAFRRVFSGAAVRAETLISLCRSIQSTHPPLHAQKFRLRRRANQWPLFARPASTRGAYRDRHGRWRQDAMDALAAPDE
jgi:hypothetical protein